MKHGHSFRFGDDDLNDKLIALLKRKAKGKFRVDEDGFVHYSHDDEDLVGNTLICAIRAKAFPSWRVISFPAHWTGSYRQYMTQHKVPFREEVRDGELRFLIPQRFRPHSWKLEEPRRLALRREKVS
jgi:hypothetical protein